MLQKKYRLPAFKIPDLAKTGNRYNSQLFTLVFKKQKKENTKQYSKFAFIVSKKIDKRATVRNKSKRRLSEGVSDSLSKIKPCYNVLILAKKRLMTTNYQTTRSELRKVFKKVKLFC
ncbi:ribonuclease P protein component [Patescibacteria group bacterium]